MRHQFWAVMVVLLAGCTRAPVYDYPRTPSSAISPNTPTAFRSAILPQERAHPGESGFRLLPSGTEAFLTRLALVEGAERSLDLQYFSSSDDRTGKLLLLAIMQAADRGVRVRLLLDDWYLDEFKENAAAMAHYPNIEIRVFNPFATRNQPIFFRIANYITEMDKLDRRMHNKALIADNQLAVMGGRNLGDEYFDASADVNFRDMDILTAGPITAKISGNFDKYWNSAESYPAAALDFPASTPETEQRLQENLQRHWQAVAASPAGHFLRITPIAGRLKAHDLELTWAKANLAADSPEKVDEPAGETVSRPANWLNRLTDDATQEFIIITPYFVPREEGVQWLTSLVKRGVRVRALTNSLASTDMVMAEAGYSHYREALVKGGVELYELKASRLEPPRHAMFGSSSANSLHAKLYVIDRRDLVIGSFNLDQRSINLNTEQVLVIHSPALAGQVADIFDRAIMPEVSYHVVAAPPPPKNAPPGPQPHPSLLWITEKNGKLMYYDMDPGAGIGRSMAAGFFSLLPIDDQL